MTYIREGLSGAMRGKTEILTFVNHSVMDIRATGEKTIETERLKSITTFNVSADHAIVQRFWNAFERMSQEERSAYLKFVWGRNRLPVSLADLSYKHEVRLYSNLSNAGFPQSHTCFFQLDIPDYQTDDMCYKRLTEAAAFCGEIDNDGGATEDLD